MKELLLLLESESLLAIYGMKTELSYKTKRIDLKTFKDCEDWIRESKKNSVKIIFKDGSTKEF